MNVFLAAALAFQPSGTPSIVQAFESACANTATVAAASDRALAAGWVEGIPSRETPIGELVLMTRAAGSPAGDRLFAKTIEGQLLHLWVRETIPAPRGQFVECGVYDFDPEDPGRTLDAIVLSRNGAPTDDISLADGTRQVGWVRLQGPSYFAGVDHACRLRSNCSPRLAFYQSVPKED